jgi:hypothetical protein
MRPSVYAEKYLGFKYLLDDWSYGQVAIRKYLNAGITTNTNYKRANAANAEKDALLGAIAKELNVKGVPPLDFLIEGTKIRRFDVQKVFYGKGSPDQIDTAIWLASRYGRVKVSNIQQWSDDHLGLDCNGFVGNYWGANPENPIVWYDRDRRKNTPLGIYIGDALIFYKTLQDTVPFHIAVVEEVSSIASPVAMKITQSAGLEKGVHTASVSWKYKNNAKGDLYFLTDAGEVVYPCDGPPRYNPNV